MIDATSVRPDDRAPLVELAKRHHVFAVAIVLDVPPEVCEQRNAARPDRDFGSHVIRNQRSALRRSIKGIRREGFRRVYVLNGTEEIDAATVVREPLWTDRRDQTGPFDIIGDVHGCHAELVALLRALGVGRERRRHRRLASAGRTRCSSGDLVDRGPAVAAGAAPRDEPGRGGPRTVHPRQSREQAPARARRAGTSRSATGSPSHSRSSAPSPPSSAPRSTRSSTAS